MDPQAESAQPMGETLDSRHQPTKARPVAYGVEKVPRYMWLGNMARNRDIQRLALSFSARETRGGYKYIICTEQKEEKKPSKKKVEKHKKHLFPSSFAPRVHQGRKSLQTRSTSVRLQ